MHTTLESKRSDGANPVAVFRNLSSTERKFDTSLSKLPTKLFVLLIFNLKQATGRSD